MNYILFDPAERYNLLPFTYTRPVALIRVGILTISEKWERMLKKKPSFLTEDYLKKKFPLVVSDDNFVINASFCPDKALISEIEILKNGEALFIDDCLIAARTSSSDISSLLKAKESLVRKELKTTDYIRIKFCYDIFSNNGSAIEADFDLLTAGRKSAAIPVSNSVIKPENIFIEEGAEVEFSILNASAGPIYIGRNAQIMEGCMIRGPLAMGEESGLKMGAKVYGPTTIGPHCKVGGEVNNVVFFGYSNKGHDGFLGNSVVGEWVNIGADTNCSNLKNTYEEVKLWNYTSERFEKTGLTFCGLMLGDHTKCGINTMFNTGTVVGIGANIFGTGFPRNFIPSFAWGGVAGFETFEIKKFHKTAEAMYKRRSVEYTDVDKEIVEEVFKISAKHRFWEN